MTLNGFNIEWVKTIKYLGTCIVGGKKLGFDIANVKRLFMQLAIPLTTMLTHWMKLCSFPCMKAIAYLY